MAYYPAPAPPAQDGHLIDGIGDVIAQIRLPVLTADDSDRVNVEGIQPVASYSWVDNPKPTIAVPGSPPIWTERSLPFEVAKDNFAVYVDQNASRVPEHPLLPMVAAVLHMQPNFEFSSVDVISDRNCLRKLLRWIRGPGCELDPGVKDFRIDVELVEKTMLFTRRDSRTTEFANRGYGHSFEMATTKDPVEGVKLTGHHRVIRYNLEGMELLVRFELDACLPADARPAAKPTDSSELLARMDHAGISAASSQNSTSQSAGATASNVPTPASPAKPALTHGIDIILSGVLVPQSHTIELTTCRRKFLTEFKWTENYLQLFLSQTENHFLGLHGSPGRFTGIEKRTLAGLTTGRVAAEQQGDLKRLGKVLRAVYNRVVEEGSGVLLSLACVGGVLTLRKRTDGRHALPDEVLAVLSA